MEIFKSQSEIRVDDYSQFKELIDKKFIVNFLSKLPIENLKELINFEVVNPFLKPEVINDEYSDLELERYTYLKMKGCVQLNAEIKL